MVNDPLSDFLNRIKTAAAVGKGRISIPHSSLKLSVANLLKDKGYVADVSEVGEGVRKTISINLLYAEDGTSRIQALKRLSKPARRTYLGASEIKPVKYGRGMLVLSTSNGILSDEEAREKGVGGEALFSIW